MRYPPGAALVAQEVPPAPAPVHGAVRVDEESVAAGAGDQDDAPGVGGGVEGAHRVRADLVVARQPGEGGHHVVQQRPVRLLPLAAAEAEAESLQRGVRRQARGLEALHHHVADPLVGLLEANLTIGH